MAALRANMAGVCAGSKARLAGRQGALSKARVGGFSGQVTMMKEGIHPEFHEEAEVYCNGEVVMTIGGTKQRYDVELWSGNHPFYVGKGGQQISNEGQVSKFSNKFDELDDIFGYDADAADGPGEMIKMDKKKDKKKK